MMLAGDIGGTKSILAVFAEAAGVLECVHERRFASRDHVSLEALLSAFLADVPGLHIDAACFGVAGPVIDGTCNATNLAWYMEESSLARHLKTPRVTLLNDLEAAAYGMLFLTEAETVVLNAGVGPGLHGNIAVLAAGTGLGEAIVYWDGAAHHAIATEGGHADFAPHSEREISLLRFLRARYGGHVSYERVLSGAGLVNVYEFLRESTGVVAPKWLTAALAAGDPAAEIARAGLAGEDRICREALSLFAHVYGVEAGNLALKCMARGGVFVGGGMAPKVLPALQDGTFMRGFTDKGRFRDLLNGIRVCVALRTDTGLEGAARYAAKLADG